MATTWRLLDYIAVDYRETIKEGVVVKMCIRDRSFRIEFNHCSKRAMACSGGVPLFAKSTSDKPVTSIALGSAFWFSGCSQQEIMANGC